MVLNSKNMCMSLAIGILKCLLLCWISVYVECMGKCYHSLFFLTSFSLRMSGHSVSDFSYSDNCETGHSFTIVWKILRASLRSRCIQPLMTEGFRRSATSLCSSVKTHFLKIPWPFALLAVPVKFPQKGRAVPPNAQLSEPGDSRVASHGWCHFHSTDLVGL